MKYVPLTRLSQIPNNLKTISDLLIYYASYAGVRANYGTQVHSWIKSGQIEKLTQKKRTVIKAIQAYNWTEVTSLEVFEKVKIKGVGEGAKSFIREHYFNEISQTYPTDRVFQRGLCHIYNLSLVTVTQAKNIISTWKGRVDVGSAFCFQVANYALKVNTQSC
jgi:hypothetical protein